MLHAIHKSYNEHTLGKTKYICDDRIEMDEIYETVGFFFIIVDCPIFICLSETSWIDNNARNRKRKKS